MNELDMIKRHHLDIMSNTDVETIVEEMSIPLVRIETNQTQSSDTQPDGLAKELLNIGATEEDRKLYNQIISASKRVVDRPGALYIASEAMPFNVYSEYLVRVKFDNDAKRVAKTVYEPTWTPLGYSHMIFGNQLNARPDIIGRNVYSRIAPGKTGEPSMFIGSIVVDKDAIERIMNMVDYTVSISYAVDYYQCDVCGQMITRNDHCGHHPGEEVMMEQNGKEVAQIVTYTARPAYIEELSFVGSGAYRTARTVAIEMNSKKSGEKKRLGSYIAMEYNAKTMVTVPEEVEEVVSNTKEKSASEEKHAKLSKSDSESQQNNKVKGEEGIMEEKLENLTKLVESLSEAIKETNSKVEAISKPAEETAPEAEVQKNEAPVEQKEEQQKQEPATDKAVEANGSEVALASALQALTTAVQVVANSYSALAEKVDGLLKEKQEANKEEATESNSAEEVPVEEEEKAPVASEKNSASEEEDGEKKDAPKYNWSNIL